MGYSTLDLLTRAHYSRDIPEAEAIALLEQRGWIRPYRFLFLLCLVPFILPERIICALGGDNWDEGPTTPNDILFSSAFSVTMIAPFVFAFGMADFAWSCIADQCNLSLLPYVSTFLLVLVGRVLKRLHGYRA